MTRTYLDHNATTPLRPEARAAMVAAMDVVGNPSSVHAEGRAAKGLVEKARAQVARALDADGADIVFTSSATEAAALAMRWRAPEVTAKGETRRLLASPVEHDCLEIWAGGAPRLPLSDTALVDLTGRATEEVGVYDWTHGGHIFALQTSNSETGVCQDIRAAFRAIKERDPRETLCLTDATQSFGKVPFSFRQSLADMAIVSAHKLGGPKGVGALVMRRGTDLAAQIKGGGQEMGWRSGTENVIGIAGFGAAAEAAALDVSAGKWVQVEKLRNILENRLAEIHSSTIFVGKGAPRLPNTSCFIAPGWKGETQVMQMDLAGFAISAGSACSSGKVKASRVLMSMGFSEQDASCAVRVSLGLDTTEKDVMRFADCWAQALKKRNARAA